MFNIEADSDVVVTCWRGGRGGNSKCAHRVLQNYQWSKAVLEGSGEASGVNFIIKLKIFALFSMYFTIIMIIFKKWNLTSAKLFTTLL